MNYKEKLFQILKCFGECEGVWYGQYWQKYGVTEDEQKEINEEYNKWEKEVK